MAWKESGTACCVSSAEGHPIQRGKDMYSGVLPRGVSTWPGSWCTSTSLMGHSHQPSLCQYSRAAYALNSPLSGSHSIFSATEQTPRLCHLFVFHVSQSPSRKGLLQRCPVALHTPASVPGTQTLRGPCANTLEVHSASLPKTPHLPTLLSSSESAHLTTR